MGDGGKPAILSSLRKSEEAEVLESDLLLAAEIGKVLLERNLELEGLLKSAHDALEEQTAQSNFYQHQLDLVRETNETQSKFVEQLDAQNSELSQKYLDSAAECRLLQGKNARLWELAESLEKKNEDLKAKLNDIVRPVRDTGETSADGAGFENGSSKHVMAVIPENAEDIRSAVEDVNLGDSEQFRRDLEKMQKGLSEARAEIQVEQWKRQELELELEAAGQLNQAHRQTILSMEEEIKEWQKIAEQAEYYRRLAAKFKTAFLEEDDLAVPGMAVPVFPNRLSKAKSCEFLNESVVSNRKVLTCPKLMSSILSGPSASSFLLELDNEYSELIKRYETLLEKCRSDKLPDNPGRTIKVQKAIQTLSIDFSTLASAITTPVAPSCSRSLGEMDARANCDTGPDTCRCRESSNAKRSPGADVDYRKLFSDIFMKLRECRESSLSS